MACKIINFLLFFFIVFFNIVSCKKASNNDNLLMEFEIYSSSTPTSLPSETDAHNIEVTTKCFDNKTKNKKIIFINTQTINQNNKTIWIPITNKDNCQLEIEKFYINQEKLTPNRTHDKKIILFNDEKNSEISKLYKSQNFSRQVTGKASYNTIEKKFYIILNFTERKHNNNDDISSIEIKFFKIQNGIEHIVRIEIKNNLEENKDTKNDSKNKLTYASPSLEYNNEKGITHGNPMLEKDRNLFNNLPKCENNGDNINESNKNFYIKILAPKQTCALVYKRNAALDFIQKFKLNNQEFKLKYNDKDGLTFAD